MSDQSSPIPLPLTGTVQRIPQYSAGDIGAMMVVATICLSVLICLIGIWFG